MGNRKEKEEMDADELVPLSYSGPIRNSPEGLSASLLPFQKVGVSWMYEQEVVSPIKGGILADEMGMGKTLQSITLILDNKSKLQHSVPNAKFPPHLSVEETKALEKEERAWEKAKEDEMKMDSKKKSFPYRGGNLVVCPLIALYQWKSEIEKFTSLKLKVCIYHGPNRHMTSQELCSYDIVLTTYNVIEAEYRNVVQKIACPNCGKKIQIG